MANTRLSMRKIKDVLRLTHESQLNTRQVALSLNISRSTVKNYQERAQKAGLSWPLSEDLTEEALEEKLFPPLVSVEAPAKALPDLSLSGILCVKQWLMYLRHESISEKNCELIHGRLPLPRTHLPVFGNVSQRQIE